MNLDRQIACVKREIALRERVYPKFVANGKMRESVADEEILAMRAVLRTLEELLALQAAAYRKASGS